MITIIKIREQYFFWSEKAGAPMSAGMTREELHLAVQATEGDRELEELPNRLARADRCGTSAVGYASVEEYVEDNRAGQNETPLSVDEIYALHATSAGQSNQSQMPEGESPAPACFEAREAAKNGERYTVLESNENHLLCEEVNKWMREGWQPIGGISVMSVGKISNYHDGWCWAQAMIFLKTDA